MDGFRTSAATVTPAAARAASSSSPFAMPPQPNSRQPRAPAASMPTPAPTPATAPAPRSLQRVVQERMHQPVWTDSIEEMESQACALQQNHITPARTTNMNNNYNNSNRSLTNAATTPAAASASAATAAASAAGLAAPSSIIRPLTLNNQARSFTTPYAANNTNNTNTHTQPTSKAPANSQQAGSQSQQHTQQLMTVCDKSSYPQYNRLEGFAHSVEMIKCARVVSDENGERGKVEREREIGAVLMWVD